MGRRDKPVILVSGGFDPLHNGHTAMLEAAAEYGDVIVALNSDDWLIRKKGYVFMPFKSRREVLLATKYVYAVIAVKDKDNTVCDALREINPDYFGNGGDRTYPHPSESRYCKLYGIEQVFGLGGDKINSSSELVEKIK